MTATESLGLVRDELSSFRTGTGAYLVLVIEPAGRVLVASGNPRTLDPTVFASICAAHFEANSQLASLVGEPEFRTLLHRGHESSIYLAGISDRALLAVVFEGARPLQEVADAGADLVSRLEEPVRSFLSANDEERRGLGSDWVQALESEIERVFREGA